MVQEEYDEDPRLGGPASTYLIDHNPIYSPGGPPARPAPPPINSLYGTMPRKQTGYTYDEDLSRQRFIHSLGGLSMSLPYTSLCPPSLPPPSVSCLVFYIIVSL